MKKTIISLLILLLVLCLAAGCGNKNVTQPPAVEPPSSEPSVSETPVAQENVSTPWSNGDFAASYIAILTGNPYYVKYRTVADYLGNKVQSVTESALDGKNLAAFSEVADMGRSGNVIKDGTQYMVNHIKKEVIIIFPAMELNEREFPQGPYVFKDSGSADFFGAWQKYEEYSSDEGNVRFFFDGDKLLGFESSVGEQKVQMEILELSATIPPAMFEIPEDYTKIDMADLVTTFEATNVFEENEEDTDIIIQD